MSIKSIRLLIKLFRQQESTYNQLLYYMCLMLQAKVSNTIEGIPFDDIGLEMKFSKIYKRMHIMEKTKYVTLDY